MTKYNESLAFTIYDLAKDGITLNAIAKSIGVTKPTLISWKKKYKKIRLAIKLGKKRKSRNENNLSLKDYVYNRLPDTLKPVWDELNIYDKETTPIGKVESLLKGKGKAAHQYLFIAALLSNNFSISKAARLIGITREAYYQWLKNDADFDKIVKEIEDIKKDFIESQFYKLVRALDTTAIIYGLKTKCKDRGYGESSTIEKRINVSGRVVIDDLPIDVREKILDAIRNRKTIESETVKDVNGISSIPLLPDRRIESERIEESQDEDL